VRTGSAPRPACWEDGAFPFRTTGQGALPTALGVWNDVCSL
jgi:hypothetical protein